MAAGGARAQDEYAELSIEQLLQVNVTSVAGVEQDLLHTPAALSVIDAEELRRSGHRSIPDALRLVPGVFVGLVDSHTWSVGTRGFNGGFGNKQLVQIDGRTTYDLLFSGTFWDVQDTLLEDLDRIEVVRGPGATLWGANAVNGVINVTTRSARDTQGLYVGGGGGSYERAFGELRYGGRTGAHGAYRVWGKYFERDDFELADGSAAGDGWSMGSGGFRVDVDLNAQRALMLDGGFYEAGELPPDEHIRGQHLIARLLGGDREHDGSSLQAYYDHTDRAQDGFAFERDTFDLDYRRYFEAGATHELIWGLGFRQTSDDTQSASPTNTVVLDPLSRSLSTLTAFAQDTLTLRPHRLFAMLGAKVEHNDFTGFELQPSARLWLTPDDRRTLWCAVSRPVRTPSRLEENISVVVPDVVSLVGNTALDSEKLTAYEAGYRTLLGPAVTLDVATFFNDYDDLAAVGGTPTVITIVNGASARSAGVEVATDWRVSSGWRLRGTYSYISVSSKGMPVDAPDGTSPHHMAGLLSFADLSSALRLDAALYFVDELRTRPVDSYVRADLGLTWLPKRDLELYLRGQNLLDDAHFEASTTVEVPRSVYLGVRLLE